MRKSPFKDVTRDNNTYNQFGVMLVSHKINISNIIPCSLCPVIARERLMGNCSILYPVIAMSGNFIFAGNLS